MTSLMVIFILLLLVFVHRTAGKDAAVADVLLKRLRQELTPQGFSENTIKTDPRDRNAILVIVPDRLMNFKSGDFALRPEGEQFLKSYVPNFAQVLCDSRFRSSIESIVVEGHTDLQGYGGTKEESQNRNLELSQRRSMEVVKFALADLVGMGSQRDCFLEKLSATGRGEQDQEATPEESRRVVFKIRIRSAELAPVKVALP